jgi:hypothetical protein
MILSTKWVPFKSSNHPELNTTQEGEPLFAIRFIEDSSIDAITQRALKLRSQEMFHEPYDPPEYL